MVSNSEFYVAILCILQFRQMAKFLPFFQNFHQLYYPFYKSKFPKKHILWTFELK